jgi:hypothetical protein
MYCEGKLLIGCKKGTRSHKRVVTQDWLQNMICNLGTYSDLNDDWLLKTILSKAPLLLQNFNTQNSHEHQIKTLWG